MQRERSRLGVAWILWCFVYGCGAHACLAVTCVTHTHTHASRMLLAHSRMPAHTCTHARTHCFGGQGQSLALLGLLCKGGLGKSAHRHASQKVSTGVFMRLRETGRCPHPGRLRCGTCAAGKLHFVPSPQTLSFVGKEF